METATEDSELRKVLEMLSGGASCDHQLQGGVLVITDKAEQKYESVILATFLALKDRGFIDRTNTIYNWHPIFRPSHMNPIDQYTITEQGIAYLSAQPPTQG